MKTLLRAAALLLFLLPSAARGQTAGRSAASVVRSKEWKVRRFPRREEEFIGDVRYQSGATHFRSDWALFQQESDLWRARGNITALRLLASGEKIETRGESAAYEQKSGKGWLAGKPGETLEFTRTPPLGLPDYGRAERLDWQGDKTAWATGRVHAWGPLAESWAEKALWRDGIVEMTGKRPVLHRKQGEDWTGAVKAERIVLDESRGTLSADGRARGWILFKDDPGEKSK